MPRVPVKDAKAARPFGAALSRLAALFPFGKQDALAASSGPTGPGGPLDADAAQAIEDAVIFGRVMELDAVLENRRIRRALAPDLLYALEALRHFRAHYGKGCPLEPGNAAKKQEAVLVDNDWSAAVLKLLRQSEEISVTARTG